MDLEKLKGTSIKDSYAHSHTLKEVLGQGGQGVVLSTDNPEIVVKLVLQDGELVSGRDKPELYARYKSIFGKTYLMPFPKHLHLAHLIATTQGYAGYIMRLMGDMKPFKELIPFQMFPATGGHRRRFELLSKAASVLAQLHAAGMVYCDINADNVFMTSDADSENQNVWLIDADNVFVKTGNGGKLVYTPGFAAPELLAGQPCTQNSDVWSFAVLAFECLSGIHPFAGNMATGNAASQSSDDGWSKTVGSEGAFQPDENPAFSGKLPWIEDAQDTRNHTTDGIPRNFFLNDELYGLFNATFSAGKNIPSKRPTSLLWARAFAHASDTTVKCLESDCCMSHIVSKGQTKCPYCGKPIPRHITLNCKGNCVFMREIGSGSIIVPERVLAPFSLKTNAYPALEIFFSHEEQKTSLNIRNLHRELELYIISPTGREEKLSGTLVVPLRPDFAPKPVCTIRTGKRSLDVYLHIGGKA